MYDGEVFSLQHLVKFSTSHLWMYTHLNEGLTCKDEPWMFRVFNLPHLLIILIKRKNVWR